MTYAERAMWTGFTPGTTAPASGVYADSGAVVPGVNPVHIARSAYVMTATVRPSSSEEKGFSRRTG